MDIVLDTETSIHKKHGPRPYYGAVHVIGATSLDGAPPVLRTPKQLEQVLLLAKKDDRVIGHNILFDLLHITEGWNDQEVKHLLSMKWWDTQLATTMISGHTNLWPSLENSCSQMGMMGWTKDNDITALFKEGVGADKIMMKGEAWRSKLTSYLKYDVKNTRDLFNAQTKYLDAYPELDVCILRSMDVLKYLYLCYRNGLPVDLGWLNNMKKGLNEHSVALRTDMYATMLKIEPCIVNATEINVTSRNVLLTLLQGGECEMITREKIGIVQGNGPLKGKARYRVNRWPLKVSLQPVMPDTLSKADLQKYRNKLPQGELLRTALTTLLIDLKDTEKLEGLVEGAVEYTRLHANQMDRIHPQLSLVGANTGRKVCSKPNAQQWPEVMRPCVKARPDHKIVSADFKQIEICGWAAMSGDSVLLADLEQGVDMHERIRAKLYNTYKHAVDRRTVKGIVFGAIYGGGAPRLSEQSGVPEDVCKAIIDTLSDTYPIAWGYWRKVKANITGITSFFDPTTGQTENMGHVEQVSGRWLGFKTKKKRWPYTELRNRPIQSFATADCVGVAEAEVVKELVRRDALTWVRVIHTVHDELVFEVHESVVILWKQYLEGPLAKQVKHYIHDATGHVVPIVLNVTVGDNWRDTK